MLKHGRLLQGMRHHGVVVALAILVTAMPVAAWVLELPASVDVAGPQVTLGDLAVGDVPEDVGSLVLVAEGRPGRTYALTRSKILRQLTTRKLAAGVVMRGAKTCRVALVGRTIESSELAQAVVASLEPWLPPTAPGGPETTVSVIGRLPNVASDGQWQLHLTEPRRLRPGRNLVALRVDTGGVSLRCTATVECIAYDEVPYAKHSLASGEALSEDLFTWRWENLGTVDPALVVGREAIADMVLARSVTVGDPLRGAYVRQAPLVYRGDSVDLILGRGGVEVTLRAVARQDGVAGQTIPVKNEINGRLVNAKVVGPGRVAWR